MINQYIFYFVSVLLDSYLLFTETDTKIIKHVGIIVGLIYRQKW
jgi:hypothetical protein